MAGTSPAMTRQLAALRAAAETFRLFVRQSISFRAGVPDVQKILPSDIQCRQRLLLGCIVCSDTDDAHGLGSI
jgi:hypothetical protein